MFHPVVVVVAVVVIVSAVRHAVGDVVGGIAVPLLSILVTRFLVIFI